MDSISPEELDCALRNIEKYNFKSLFEKRWYAKVFNFINGEKDRNKVHDIFWLLQEDSLSSDL